MRDSSSYENVDQVDNAPFRLRRLRPSVSRRTLRPALPGGAVPAGARHHVLTSKHHEGFALRDTKLSDRNAAGRSAGAPTGGSLVIDVAAAARRTGKHAWVFKIAWSG
ncbi:alpha-L-fucosidase [Streptomyces sp. NPDC059153]|uniref:alpha-L-fucosidase n=1 Tax=Streptomyces sp. NPDC059153 TaxID=3346743 RepID=UPI0036C4EF34